MDAALTRRGFLALAGAASAGVAFGPTAAAAVPQTRLRKALIRGLPDAAVLAALKEAGFDGLECNAWSVAPADAEAARERAAAAGLAIHSVLRGWCNFNNPDPAKVAEDIASVKTALKTAQLLGADALLLVPCRVAGGPKPWEFAYEYDPATCLVSRVVAGDNTPFAAYMAAHNAATEASRKAVETLIPEAEACGVTIALENVWNNLWVKPDLFASLVRSFRSRWVQAYLDLGNHVKYAPTTEWINALGETIAKCHVKDFALNPDGRDGKFVDIRDGSVDWPAVRAALQRVGYTGWLTIEGSGGLSLADQNRRLELIIAGQ